MKSNKKKGSRTRSKVIEATIFSDAIRFAIHEAFTQNSMGISWAFLFGPMFKDKPQAMTPVLIQAQCLRERPPLRDSDAVETGMGVNE